ncbi:permease [Jiangella aurantiaca]|uniref:Permease n=1 Tax=Jiangella aurantiaca TaxID=2530373 RepID=A0A4R5A3Z7_9ACTN|nr:FtsX-like permease family protein [Jiangella aurantiaca]TDD65394.1 permease [Jiangella aurantiaca]
MSLLTVGRTAAAEADVLARLDAAGSRSFTFIDTGGTGFITDAVVGSVASMNVVERAVGIALPVDVVNGAVGEGTKAPAWRVNGDLDAVATVIAGRDPAAGEALVSHAAMRALGLDQPVGWIAAGDGTHHAIVGSFLPRAPFNEFATGLVIAAAPGDPISQLRVVAHAANDGDVLQRAVLATMKPPEPSDLQIESPAVLADAQRAIAGDLGTFSRGLVLGVIAASGLFTAVVVLADVLLSRSDLGRRRALGAPRWALVTIVTGRAVLAAIVGATTGTAAGLISLIVTTDQTVPSAFSIGVAILAVLTAALAALPFAIIAAFQDPVRVLRTP